MPALMALLMPVSVVGASGTQVTNTLREAAYEHKIPFRLLYGVCRQESGLRPHAFNINDGGTPSRGLCQLKLGVARAMGFDGPATDLFKLGINAHYAAKLLKYQLVRYSGDWVAATSAYNAGHASMHNKGYVKSVFNYAMRVKYDK